MVGAVILPELLARYNFDGSPYGYTPTRWIVVTFIALFGLSTVLHISQAVYYRMWWLFPTACLCGILEIMGWSARLWSNLNVSLSAPFEMQVTTTIIGPTPFLAANFIILGMLIQRLGIQYSRLVPKWYAIVFCTCDIISLAVQAVGGAKAAAAAGSGGRSHLLGGIAFQRSSVTISIYAFCAFEYYVRYTHNWPVRQAENGHMELQARQEEMTGQWAFMRIALLISTVCLFIRAIYRTVELSDGWSGKIITTEVLFNTLDGAMIVLAMFTMNFAHPGRLIGGVKLAPAYEPFELFIQETSDTHA